MTRFTPDYGETPVSPDEAEALLSTATELLGPELSKASVYDLEQAIQQDVAEFLLTGVLDGSLALDNIVSDRFLRDLHAQLYGDVWAWAGTLRRRELNIGVAPERIAVELRGSLESILYRWQVTDDWTPREFGIAVHAETVRIHPFVDGNGRSTRLLADLVFVAAQNGDQLDVYDWDIDKDHYISLLRQYDQHRDAHELAAFVPVRRLGE